MIVNEYSCERKKSLSKDYYANFVTVMEGTFIWKFIYLLIFFPIYFFCQLSLVNILWSMKSQRLLNHTSSKQATTWYCIFFLYMLAASDTNMQGNNLYWKFERTNYDMTPYLILGNANYYGWLHYYLNVYASWLSMTLGSLQMISNIKQKTRH